jgi:hypothetical protein
MSFRSLLARLFTSQRPELLADKVAFRSRHAVWERVSRRIHSLSGAEARGYIRARGAAILEPETDKLIREEGGKAASLRDKILHGATETVIRVVMEQAQSSRPAAAARRRAA